MHLIQHIIKQLKAPNADILVLEASLEQLKKTEVKNLGWKYLGQQLAKAFPDHHTLLSDVCPLLELAETKEHEQLFKSKLLLTAFNKHLPEFERTLTGKRIKKARQPKKQQDSVSSSESEKESEEDEELAEVTPIDKKKNRMGQRARRE